jgi:K+/H+ antiporter YhaU regulatory subunit KhtT
MLDESPAFALAEKIRSFQGLIELHWTQIQPESPLAGCSIADSGVRARTGISIVGFIRAGVIHANPGPDTVLESGDVIAAIGNAEQTAAFATLTRSAMASSPESAAQAVSNGAAVP